MYPDNGFAAAITELKDTLSNEVSNILVITYYEGADPRN